MSRVYAAFKDFPSLPLLYTHHSYDEWHFSEQYFGRVKFSRQVRVRPVDQMLPPGAPPLGSTYERLRHDATRNTNWHLRRNGRRTRDHKLPPAAIPLRQIPPIVDPSPRVRPSEPRDPTSHVRTSNRHQQKPYGEPRQQSRVHPKQENFPRHSQPTAQRPVAHPHTSTRPSAKPEPQKLKKPTRQSEASRSQWNLPQENHKPPRTTRGCPYEFFARTLRRTFRSTSINPALGIHSSDIQWDMRQSPTLQNGAHVSGQILKQPALSSKSDSPSCMVVKHDLLPWPILVHADIEHELTVGDVLKAISESLHAHIGTRDWGNLRMREGTMEAIARAAQRRRARPESYRRVDVLGKAYMFGGLEHVSGTHFRVRSFAP